MLKLLKCNTESNKKFSFFVSNSRISNLFKVCMAVTQHNLKTEVEAILKEVPTLREIKNKPITEISFKFESNFINTTNV